MSHIRIDALRKKLQAENIDALIVTNMPQIRFLTGFSGDTATLVLTRTKCEFFTDFRFTDQARQQVRGAKVTITKGEAFAGIKDTAILKPKNLRVGYSGSFLTVSTHQRMQKMLPDALLLNADSMLSDLGWVKDNAELVNIEKACQIADRSFERILAIIKPGVRESDVAAELEYQMLMLGSERPAFETIIASGYRAAMPHGVASRKRIAKGDFVTLDFGATVGGSVSDITRTIVVGKATPRHKKIYSIVLRAQLAGIRRVKAGINAKLVDAACRVPITRAGYGKNFGHSTGHGIGIFIHMGPRVSELSTDKLMVGNIITIEPGIYISGWGGVRIEDDVLVTRSGGKVLTKAPKNLLEL